MTTESKLNGYCKGEIVTPQEEVQLPKIFLDDPQAALMRLREAIDDIKLAIKEGDVDVECRGMIPL
jgi:hypothetical protein